jgi:hypothetical protein
MEALAVRVAEAAAGSEAAAARLAHWRVTGTVNMPFTNKSPLTQN